jgi:uncharacterized membrane protein
MTRILAAIALIAGAVLMTAPAEAGFTLCNKSKAGANVALGYADGATGWMAEGWWSIASGDCQTLVKNPLAGSYVYLLVDGGRLPPRARQSGGWFCTDDNGFGTRNADYANDKHELACEDAGLKTEQFREIKIRGSEVTYNLRR